LAFQQSDLDNINAAISSGVLKVKYKDKEVTYASMDEMLKARALIVKELDAASGQSTGANDRIKFSYRKGFAE